MAEFNENDAGLLADNLRESSSGASDLYSQLKGIISELGTGNNLMKEVTKELRGLTDITKQLKYDEEGINILNKKQLENLKTKAQIRAKELASSIANVKINQEYSEILEKVQEASEISHKSALAILSANKENLKLSQQEIEILSIALQGEEELKDINENILGIIDKRLEKEKLINKNIGISGVAVKGLGGLFKKMGVDSTVVGDAVSKSDTAMRSAALSGGKLKTAAAGLGTLFRGITASMGPMLLISLFVEGLVKADKETTELKKSMALTTWESEKFRTNLALAAATSGNINITTSKLLETFSSINKQFGFISNFSADTLVATTKLSQVVGIAGESANNLAAASELNGINFETAYKNSLGTSYEMQRQAGVQFDLRDILTESGKVTGQIRANLGANPSKLAEAVTQSKLFGASLQEVNAAGKAFLDFESSIENELQAELLLGKDINLEGARRAALNGDQAALARELTAQAGSFSEYSKMNVLQQQSLAQALGMSSDQLSDILFKQGVQGRSARELRALGEDELAQRLESQTLADKFSATMDKLKGIFTDVATAFMPVLVVLGAALGIVGAIVGLVRDLIVGIGSLFGWTKFGESGFLNGLKGTAGLLGIPTGDIISPANGITQISTKEGGLYNLSRNDDVIAAPGLINKLNSSQSSNSAVQNIIYDNKEARETNMLLRQILTKQGTVQIDNTKIGTAFAMNTYEIQ